MNAPQDYHSNIRHDVVPLVPDCDRLLDVGGGVGATARHLKAIGRAKSVGVMDAVIEEHRYGIDFASSVNLDDAEAVDAFLAENGPFDVILTLDVLEHLVDPWRLVRQLAGHLAPGGALVASVPNVRHLSVVKPLLFGNQWTYSDSGLLDRTHLRFFVRDSAVALLKQAELTVDRVKGTEITNRRHKLLNLLSLGRFTTFFTLQYLIRGRRYG